MKIFLILTLTCVTIHANQVRDFWFSGAEISSFELSQSRYGENHPGHAELIFVTEPFLIEKQVKDESSNAQASSKSTDVLKLNALTTFNTGLYSYRTMTSTFRPIDLQTFPHALKSTTSIQDWCGQAFQQTNFKNSGWQVQLRSYFENHADQDLTLPATHLEDEIWLTLRLDPKSLPIGEIQMIPGAIFTRFHHHPIAAIPVKAELAVRGKTSTYTLFYPSINRALSIGFDTSFPHVIRAWTEKTPTGTTKAVLKKRLMNVDYWNLNQRKHMEKRRQLKLEPIAD